VFVVDFDNPQNPGRSATGSGQPLDLEYLISFGDSGGGAFADLGDGNGPVLVGVHSFGETPDGVDDSGYGDVTGHVRVSRSVDWIRSVLRRNGEPGAAARFAAGAVTDRRNRSGRSAALADYEGAAPVPEPGPVAMLACAAAAAVTARPARSRHPARPACRPAL